jgi:hypothetical protein
MWFSLKRTTSGVAGESSEAGNPGAPNDKPTKLPVEDRGIPHLAKNERDVGPTRLLLLVQEACHFSPDSPQRVGCSG